MRASAVVLAWFTWKVKEKRFRAWFNVLGWENLLQLSGCPSHMYFRSMQCPPFHWNANTDLNSRQEWRLREAQDGGTRPGGHPHRSNNPSNRRNPGCVDKFQLTRTTEESSMFARRTAFRIFTIFTVTPDEPNEENELTFTRSNQKIRNSLLRNRVAFRWFQVAAEIIRSTCCVHSRMTNVRKHKLARWWRKHNH